MITRRRTIKNRLFAYYILLFAIFTFSVLVFQNHREKQFRIEQLGSRLNEYTALVERYIVQKQIDTKEEYKLIDSLNHLIPPELIRITVLNVDGEVLYDNSVADYSEMENHADRPEIQKARYADKGYNIRKSATTHQDYFYYARYTRNLIVRAAMVYNVEVRNFLKIERAFISFLILLFLLFGIVLLLIGNNIGDSITKLKEYVIKAGRNEEIPSDLKFANDELGAISNEIARLYDKAGKAKKELILEKEKLISHLFVLREGVAFFSSDKKVILHNSHFIVFANIISEDSSISVDRIFHTQEWKEMNAFIDKILAMGTAFPENDPPRQEYSIQRGGLHFHVQCIFFQDRSFEILITDNTQMVKRSIMKQQLTSNIAHELKTPISSVKGFLETIRNNPGLEPEKSHYFVEKAYKQTERLSKLVNDIALLNKIEESSELYAKENVAVRSIFQEVTETFIDELKNKPITIENMIRENVIVKVNYSLLFSVFRNLMENSLNYGGSDITVTVSNYHEDSNFYYFSFTDNGLGVEEEHLPRLFERFYRVDSGRSRKLGGTGLGLAIVKNAILSFKGDISVRKRQEGGLEFLFSLPK